jgi:hypothetical protein
MATNRMASRGVETMGLKAPGIVTFMLSVILTVTVLIIQFFGAQVPFITGNEFWALLLAQIILVFGCIMRGL